LVELAPEIALAELRGVVAGADRLDFLLDLGVQLPLDLRLLPPQLWPRRVPRAEPPLQARELGPEVQQREVQLLQARTVEEVGEQVAVRPLAEEPVAALETEARTFRVRELLREVRDPLRDGLLLLVDGDVRVLGGKAVERRLGALHLLSCLLELAPEELLGRDVVGAPRLLVGVEVCLGVRRREEGREGGVRGREAHLQDIGPADLLDRDVAHVAVDELGSGGRPTPRLVRGGAGRGALETPRADEPRQGVRARAAPAPPGATSEGGPGGPQAAPRGGQVR